MPPFLLVVRITGAAARRNPQKRIYMRIYILHYNKSHLELQLFFILFLYKYKRLSAAGEYIPMRLCLPAHKRLII